jgi:hypothetical protein
VLYLVLALVVAAFGLLIAALATANTLWAWISVGVSVVAAVVLVIDWLAGRRRVAATVAAREHDRADTPATESTAATETTLPGTRDDAVPVVDTGPDRDLEGSEPDGGRAADPTVDDAPAEPPEEATDAADLLVISDLDAEVRVIDEHPRYHLARCSWLAGKATIPLPVSEARQLGFTPCARCGPDAALAAGHRAKRGAER